LRLSAEGRHFLLSAGAEEDCCPWLWAAGGAVWGNKDIVESKYSKPAAWGIGFINGLYKGAEGTVKAITSPWQTIKGIGLAAFYFAPYNYTPEAISFRAKTGEALSTFGNNLFFGSPFESGTAWGELGFAAVGTRGLGLGTAGRGSRLASSSGKVVKAGEIAKGGRTTLYRAVSQAEVDDIAINGIRNAPGYETGKLFATSAQDAANFGRLNFSLDKQPFTIIRTSISNKYASILYRGEMDLMQSISVPNNLFNQLSKPSILNHIPLPNHPWIK
jgi:hypothetical protein